MKIIRPFLLLLPALSGAGCVGLATQMANNLSQVVLNQTDPELVRAGAPAYLLLIDSFIAGDPDDEDLLQAGASLYAAYAALFVTEDLTRRQELSSHAWDYGQRALCEYEDEWCGLRAMPFARFQSVLAGIQDPDDVPVLFAYAQSWLVWIDSHRDDWRAVAELPKVQAVLERVLALDETYQHGAAHLYLGMLETLRPAALGGRPESGRQHFERALELSDGRDLSAKVAIAERYARLLFDRALHDRLLREVLAADAQAPGLTLTNTLAKQRAAELLRSADEYFGIGQ